MVVTLKDIATRGFRMDQYWNLEGYREILDVIQCLQVIDVIFAALKVTNNNVIATFVQVFSRVAMVLSIFPLLKAPSSPTDMSTVGIFLCMMNWSMIEVIRFGFYFSKAQNPDGLLCKILSHLRYNVFIFAYVLGVTGENFAIYYGY